MTLPPLPGLRPLSVPEPGWRPLMERGLLILVGLTGVGKSTALGALTGSGLNFAALPNRREIVDALILAGEVVQGRAERFRRTAAYRARHPGGVAAALASLWAEDARWPDPLLFDGLRGEAEVRFAARHFPRARFVGLHAPDPVRVRRLLRRADAFDAAAGQAGENVLERLREETGGLFSEPELAELVTLTAEGFSPEDILAKTRIVALERREYDSEATLAALSKLSPERALTLDTSALSPDEVARSVGAWL